MTVSYIDGKVVLVARPTTLKAKMMTIGIGAAHSLTIGARIVIERAIMPQVPTDVFLLFAGKILSSVNEIYVVVIKFKIMPSFNTRIKIGMDFSSNLSLASVLSNGMRWP